MVANCNPRVSRLCGRACVSWAKRCRGDPIDELEEEARARMEGMGAVPPSLRRVGPRVRKDPNCTLGRTRRCGKACISLTRNCKKDGTRGVVGVGLAACAVAGAPVGRRQFDQRLMDVATQARLAANRARVGTARRKRLEKVAFEALLKAAQAVRPDHACGRSEARRVAMKEEARLLREAQEGGDEDEGLTGVI